LSAQASNQIQESDMTTKMTQTEREIFLSELRVGVLSIEDPGRGPLTVPVWYDYEPGGKVWFLTGPESIKGKLLAKVSRASLCVQQESLPYKYVSVEGPLTCHGAADTEQHSRPMAHRYLGQEMGDAYIASNRESDSSFLYHLMPERWLTVDYGKE
jgi:general stress protein 26